MARTEILLKLQAKELACHNFADTGRRHEAPGLEIKDFLIHSNRVSRLSACSLAASLSPKPHRAMRRRLVTSEHTVGCVRGQKSDFRKPGSFIIGSRQARCFSEGNIVFIILYI